MSESRGAASVTLDTIIANALRESMRSVLDEGAAGNTFAVNECARAVTDALLANWEAVDAAIEAHCVALKVSKS